MNFIYKTTPMHTTEGVPVDRHIEFYFMLDINVSSFKQENIILLNMTEQVVEPVQIKYNRRVLSVVPINKLKPNSHYQIALIGGETGIKDITGRKMEETYELEFSTKETDLIKPPLLLSPTDKSILKEAATFVFDEVENASYFELQISKSNTFHNLIWPLEEEKIHNIGRMNVTPDISYEAGTYYARIRSIDNDGAASDWSKAIRYYFDNEPVIEEAPEELFPGTEPVPKEEESVQETEEPVQEPTQETEEVEEIAEQPVEEQETEPVIEPEQEQEIGAMNAKAVVRLKSKTRVAPNETQLMHLKQTFSVKAEDVASNLLVKSSIPKDGQVNMPNANLNATKQFIVEFTDILDANSINNQTCYVLEERN